MRRTRPPFTAALAAVLLFALPSAARAMEVDPDATSWSTLGNHVPVCWVDPGYSVEKQLMQAAVERGFARTAPLSFAWRDGCPTDGTQWWVKIKIFPRAGSPLAEVLGAQAGITALSSPVDGWDYGVVLGLPPTPDLAADRYACAGVNAMARVLGFRDLSSEPDRLPRLGEGSSECTLGASRGGLSERHARTLRATYGGRPDRPTALADLDGDGRDDLIAVNLDGIYALRSTGAGFGDWARWSGPFYGQRETAFADVDGDGDDDAIAVNDEGIYVLRSDGAQLADWARWTGFPFWGERRTLVGDVDGDGRADAVAITDDHVWVLRSTGAGFGPIEWWGPRPGDATGSALADWDGDGRADLQTYDRGRLLVHLSTGAGFASATLWRGDLSRPTRGLGYGDATGDGRADAIVLGEAAVMGYDAATLTSAWWYPEIGVDRSWYPRGGYLLPAARAELLGDVDGDGRVEIVLCTEQAVEVQWLDATGADLARDTWWSAPFYALP